MATAKQIAARKRFAAMAKSGELKRLATKARKKNPKPRTRKQDLAIAMSEQRAGHSRKAKEFFERAARAKNPVVIEHPKKVFLVESSRDKKVWDVESVMPTAASAKHIAEAVHAAMPGHYIRVRDFGLGK